MNPIFISTSLLVGSTIVNGACLGTMTFTQSAGGATMAIGMCMVMQENGASGSLKHECVQGVLHQTMYSDNECQTPLMINGAAATYDIEAQGTAETGSCSGDALIAVDDCDYLMMYQWDVASATDLCGTAAEAIASGTLSVESDIATKITGGMIVDCADMSGGQGTAYGSQTVASGGCSTDFYGDVMTLTQFTDAQCQNPDTNATPDTTVTNDPTAVATVETEEQDDGNGGTVTVTNYVCRQVHTCTSGLLTDAPTAAPSAAPSAAPTASPVATPATDAPSAAPTTATASTPAPTTASSSAVQSSSIIALLVASFYAIIA